MLRLLDAKVSGYSLPPPSAPHHHGLLPEIDEALGDIRDQRTLETFFTMTQPDIVFHLAAQPLVLPSYEDPYTTYETNVMGTLRVLEATRKTTARALVVITSDKCYDNKEWPWAYRENDAMGGHDPYSSSKGCAELLVQSYRKSFFSPENFGSQHHLLIASTRAGNVLGGGDWAEPRLIPDLIRAYFAGQPLQIRNPQSVRPWQHVLDPLWGYLLLGERLLKGELTFAKGYNFGPDGDHCVPVRDILSQVVMRWPDCQVVQSPPPQHEANLLMLDSTLARRELNWRPHLDIKDTINWTLQWYEAYYRKGEVVTDLQIQQYLENVQ